VDASGNRYADDEVLDQAVEEVPLFEKPQFPLKLQKVFVLSVVVLFKAVVRALVGE
jgi:hypothetical protein